MTSSISDETKLALYRTMKRIRMVEMSVGERFQDQQMRTPMHLSIGQEAIAAGVCKNLRGTDYVYSNHRGHGHYLAKNGDLVSLIAELYNRIDGCSSGKGGSMHIIDPNAGFGLTSSIVAGNVPIAVGHALANQLRHTENIVVVFLGDGASEEGVVYESICFAKVHLLPVVFVCENNLYSMHTPFSCREPLEHVGDKFVSLLKTATVDGNDVQKVYVTASEAISFVRSGHGPVFLEYLTYRLRDHYETKNGNPLGTRDAAEYNTWLERCPVRAMERKLLSEGLIDDNKIRKLEQDIQKEIEEAFHIALSSPYPDKEELMKGCLQ